MMFHARLGWRVSLKVQHGMTTLLGTVCENYVLCLQPPSVDIGDINFADM